MQNKTPSNTVGDTPTKRATIHDVASAASVAVGTVSRYLSGQPVRAQSRKRIEETIAELGFVRNMAAATIRGESSRLIGFLVSSYDELQITLLAQLTARLQESGRLVLPLTHDGRVDAMEKALTFFAEHRIEALIASGDFPAMGRMHQLLGSGTRIILFNNDLSDIEADRVFFEDAGAMEKAVSHLAGIGHRRIGIVAGRNGHTTAAGRLLGYRTALEKGGLPFDPALVAGHEWTRQTGYFAAQTLLSLQDPPSAIVCSSYLNAMGVLDLTRERNIAVPDDLSIISFGDAESFQLIQPGIDAVRLPTQKTVDAIEHLYNSFSATRPMRKVTLECEFVVRGSSRSI